MLTLMLSISPHFDMALDWPANSKNIFLFSFDWQDFILSLSGHSNGRCHIGDVVISCLECLKKVKWDHHENTQKKIQRVICNSFNEYGLQLFQICLLSSYWHWNPVNYNSSLSVKWTRLALRFKENVRICR